MAARVEAMTKVVLITARTMERGSRKKHPKFDITKVKCFIQLQWERRALGFGRWIRASKIGCSQVHPISIMRLENIFTSLSAAALPGPSDQHHAVRKHLHVAISCCTYIMSLSALLLLACRGRCSPRQCACMQVCACPCASSMPSSMPSSMHIKSKTVIVTHTSYIWKGTHHTKRIYYHN
jgi:hypothetical protein